jgi:hypothetical protein
MPAAPDRACRWNDLEASWSFYSRNQRSVISNRKGLLIAAQKPGKRSIPVWATDVGMSAIGNPITDN